MRASFSISNKPILLKERLEKIIEKRFTMAIKKEATEEIVINIWNVMYTKERMEAIVNNSPGKPNEKTCHYCGKPRDIHRTCWKKSSGIVEKVNNFEGDRQLHCQEGEGDNYIIFFSFSLTLQAFI